MPPPSIVISPELTNGIFAGEKESATTLFNALYGTGLPPPFTLNPEKKLSISLAARTETVPTQNVVAVWEGSDPVLKDEYVAVGAHYDHIGICAPGGPDPICNGADDDDRFSAAEILKLLTGPLDELACRRQAGADFAGPVVAAAAIPLQEHGAAERSPRAHDLGERRLQLRKI